MSRLPLSPHASGEESPDSSEYRTPQKGGLSNVMGQKVLKRFKPPMAFPRKLEGTGKAEKVE